MADFRPVKTPAESRLRLMQWLIVLGLAATTLVFVVNVNDSTMLKRPLLYLACGLLGATWLSQSLGRGRVGLVVSGPHLALLAYLALSSVSALKAPNLRLAGIGIADLSCFFILFTICTELFPDRGFQRMVVRSLIVISLLACIVAIYQILAARLEPASADPRGRETISTFGNVTYFAGFLAPISLIIVSQLLGSVRPVYRIILGLLLVTVLYLLITTESRSAWAGAGAGVVLLILLNTSSGRIRLVMIGTLLAGAVVLLLLFPEMVQRRLAGILEVGPTSSIARRLYFYRGAWQAFLSSPLIGQGIGNFAVFFSKFRSPEYWMAHSEDIVPHAHNELLEILSETGIAGFAAFTAAVFLCIRSAGKRLGMASGSDRYLLTGVLAAVTAILVDNLASMNLRTMPVAAIFWLLLGFAARSDTDHGPAAAMTLPGWSKTLRPVPYLLLGAILVWYIPILADHYQAQGQYLSGNLSRYRHNTVESTLRYRDALAHDPDLAEVRFYLGANLAELGRYDEAKRTIDTVLIQSPYFPQARFVLGISLFSLGDTMNAVKAFDEEMRIENSPQTVYYASIFQRRLGNAAREIELMKTLLRNAIRSGSNQFVPEGIARLSELCPALGTTRECVELQDDVKRAFPQLP